MESKLKIGLGIGLLSIAALIGLGLKKKTGGEVPIGPSPDINPEEQPVDNLLPINVYFVRNPEDQVGKILAKPGWITWNYSPEDIMMEWPIVPFLGATESWYVNGVALGHGLGGWVNVCPECGFASSRRAPGPEYGYWVQNGDTNTCPICGYSCTYNEWLNLETRAIDYTDPIRPEGINLNEVDSVKVVMTDGVHTGETTLGPNDFVEDYGRIPSNASGYHAHAYGPGKPSGIYVYNNMGLEPESVWVSFKKTKYPDAAWSGPNSLGAFTIYGYGTGSLDYNLWTWTVCTLLEQYWRPMIDGESVLDFTTAAYYALKDSSQGIALYVFITSAAIHLASMFDFGASVLWDRSSNVDGTEEHPYVYTDGWQGPGYYLMLPGSIYGTAQYVSESQKDVYF